MKRIWEFYENLSQVVYASDIESYELIYMNRKARELHGFKTVDEFKGKKCYEVLQHCSSPCAICTDKNLKFGAFEEWKYYNPIFEKTFILKDTIVKEGKKRCRLEIALDMTAQESQIQTIREYVNHETIINEGLRIALSTPIPDESIQILLEYIGKTFNSDRAYIFEENQAQTIDNTYEWCAEDVIPQKKNLQNIPIEDAQIWMQRFQNNKNVIINKLSDIEETDPIMYQYLMPQSINSLVVSPLIINNKIVGFYGVDNPYKYNLENISGLFYILGYFIVSLLKSRNLVKKLENLSYYDRLTKFGNRHAMDAYIENMKPEKSIGVIYCDVMGLKKVNDNEGHHAGDALIIRACECIRRVFGDYFMFRIGGDEFLILCAGIKEDELAEKVEELKKDMTENKALMAIGSIWRPDSKEDMDKLLGEADENMYIVKREYYADKDRRKQLDEENEKTVG